MKSKIHELQKINLKTVSKKMFFTAVALVAFSFTSMANTIKVKEVVIPVEEEIEVLKLSPCAQAYLDDCASYSVYFNDNTANQMAFSNYWKCIGG